MELREAIKSRRSVRQFRDDPVPPEFIKEILQLARRAPSAGGLRAYTTCIVNEHEEEYIKEQMHQITHMIAPVSLVICAMPKVSEKRYGTRGRNLYAIQDATIFGAYIQLIAVDLGLSSVWIGAFSERRVRKVLKLSEDMKPIAIIRLGYAWN